MRVYVDQPDEMIGVEDKDLARFIVDFLTEEIPNCPTNKWFVESVHLANMVDKLVEEINDGH